MERVLTCDGIGEFGHCGVISAAVKYKEVGQNKSAFTGQMFVSFATHEIASLYQSYWRDRPLFTSPHIRDENGRITQKGNSRLMQCGLSGVVGKRWYKRGPFDRTYTRWGADVWSFWGPSYNQSITRQMAGLDPLPEHFLFGGRRVTRSDRGY